MRTTTHSCLCCGNSLLRHVRHQGVYWFCQSCRQEVPLLSVSQSHFLSQGRNTTHSMSPQLILT
ncbi:MULTISPECIES: hypothetical protein [Nostocales]|uniref:Uncharacterized protein n=3 Tax=Nostocales TaxID=1161 RepID=A0A8S9T031_9CYAN|nr:hypothetical protein [Tolypothrix bouteillei]KAF3885981.1 hypothetical protein DA73_0400011245 [Tolypothrix bouteillei VB521301]